MEEDERKFLGEYHFPITLKEVEEWSKNFWRIERGTVFLQDTVNLDLLKRGYWLIRSFDNFGDLFFHTIHEWV